MRLTALPDGWTAGWRPRRDRWAAESVPRPTAAGWLTLGAAPLGLFAMQVVTGVLLALHYRASAAEAYESTRVITAEVGYGWFVRGLHGWCAVLLLATALLHQLRAWLSAAYRPPRQWLWVVGWVAVGCLLAASFTGDALVDDQQGRWSLVMGANLLAELPAVGPPLSELLVGGPGVGPATLPRLFVWHAVVLPSMAALLLALHVVGARRLGPAEPADGSAVPTHRLWPDQLQTDLCVGLALLLLLTVLATLAPATLGPAADRLHTPEALRPAWYALPVVRWVKLVCPAAAAISLALGALGVLAWPWLDQRVLSGRVGRRLGLRRSAPWVGVAATCLGLALMVWEAAAL